MHGQNHIKFVNIKFTLPVFSYKEINSLLQKTYVKSEVK